MIFLGWMISSYQLDLWFRIKKISGFFGLQDVGDCISIQGQWTWEVWELD